MQSSLRIIVVAPELASEDTQDDHALSLIERSKTLRIGLLENGYKLIARAPFDHDFKLPLMDSNLPNE
jgi:two-component system, response regulator / RNA-binding antiterminator